jgi:hypothetical protein
VSRISNRGKQNMALEKTKGRVEGLGRTYAAHRYAIVFYSLLLTLCAAPLLEALQLDARLLLLFVAMNLLAAAFGVNPGRGRRVLLAFVGIALALRVVSEFTTGTALGSAALILWALLAVVATASTVRFAMRSEDVSLEHLYAALSGYVLAGVFFGVLYAALEKAWPGSLMGAGVVVVSGGLPISSAIYFSFVTLATLGYGDIVPGTELTRGLAIFEAVGAQIYIAVMIARLVTLYAQRKRSEKP